MAKKFPNFCKNFCDRAKYNYNLLCTIFDFAAWKNPHYMLIITIAVPPLADIREKIYKIWWRHSMRQRELQKLKIMQILYNVQLLQAKEGRVFGQKIDWWLSWELITQFLYFIWLIVIMKFNGVVTCDRKLTQFQNHFQCNSVLRSIQIISSSLKFRNRKYLASHLINYPRFSE